MLGKSFRATGSRNSMKGTMMNTRKGRSLKTSAHVLRNWGEDLEKLELELKNKEDCFKYPRLILTK